VLFPTIDFAVLFLLVAPLAWGVAVGGRHSLHKAVLVGASYIFYSAWDWRFCALLAASSLGNWVIGLGLGALREPGRVLWGGRGRAVLLAFGVSANLAVLGYFKYCNFFLESLDELAFRVGVPVTLPFHEVILPIGISFFTFHGLSYLFDVGRGTLAARRSPLDLLLYISFFPQLVAGPIVRASDFIPQLDHPPRPREVALTRGLLLILLGLFKKVVIAHYLATLMVDHVFLAPALYGPVDLLLAVYGYAVQIYCDFSAYSDMAIGLAALLGYQFRPNFNQPYRAVSLSDFWRRWHISLSSWFRDYLYIPLGGRRCGKVRAAVNALATMLLCGLWHGAAWNFVAWGGLHGIGLIVERMTGWPTRVATAPAWGRLLGMVVVFHFVCLGWILFRCPDPEAVGAYLNGLAGFPAADALIAPTAFATPALIGLIGFGLALNRLPPDSLERLERRVSAWPAWFQGALAGIAIIAIDAAGPQLVAPFIYFQF